MLTNKKIFWLVLILVSILCFLLSQGSVFCAEKTIAVLVPNGADPYFQAKWYGYQDEASKLGYKHYSMMQADTNLLKNRSNN